MVCLFHYWEGSKMNVWYENLSQDYQKNIDPFLQHFKMTCASKLTHCAT